MKPRISLTVRNASRTAISKLTGYTRTHIRRLLTGQNKGSIESFAAVSSALNISMDELYWHVEAMKAERKLLALRKAGKLTLLQMKRMERRVDG